MFLLYMEKLNSKSPIIKITSTEFDLMKLFRRIITLCVIVLVVVAVSYFTLPIFNDFQDSGVLKLPGLKSKVIIQRDEKGMAYIKAGSIEDAIMAQGFVTAQDRLFQMNLTRLFSSGRISELAGDVGKPTDVRMRTIGFRRNAEKHAKILSH